MLISHFTIITLSGDVTGSGTGSFAVTIANNAVSNAKLRDSAALSVIGRSANSAGDPADIAAAANDTLLRRSGNALDFGPLTVGMAPDGLWTYAKLQNVAATDRILGRSTAGAGVIEEIACTAFGRAQLALTTLTAHGIVLGNGASAVAVTAVMTDGQVLVGQSGADPLPRTMSGDATLAASGALTIANDAVTNAKLANMAASTVKGQIVGGSGDPVDLSADQLNAILSTTTTTPTFPALKIKDAAGDNTITLSTATDEAADRTLTIPALGGNKTLALVNLAQTFSADQTLGAGVSLSGAAGAGTISLGSMTGNVTLPTGSLSYAGASGKAAAIGTTAGNLTISTTTSGALAVNSAAALTLTAGATSVWHLNAGDLTISTAGDSMTLSAGSDISLSATFNISLAGGSLTFSGTTVSCTSSAGALTIDGKTGVDLRKNGTTYADVGVTTASTITLAANIALAGAAGTGAISLGSMTGDVALPTGALSYTGASGKTAALGTTAANLTVSTTTSGTLAVTSAGALTLTGAAASTWSTSSGALTITSAAAATWSVTSGTLTLNGSTGVALQYGGATKLATSSGGVSVTGNQIISGSLGLGGVTPSYILHAKDAAGPSIQLEATANGSFAQVFAASSSASRNCDMYIGNHDTGKMYFRTSSTADSPNIYLTLSNAGNIGVGTSSFPSGGGTPVIVLTQASGNPTGMPGDTCGIFGKNVTTTCELFAIDEAGNVTQLSAHATDGPDWLYDFDQPHPDRVECSENVYTGTKEWVNTSRKARLLERLLAGEDISLLPREQRTVTHVVSGLPKRDWDEDQQALRTRREQDIAAQQERSKAADEARAAWDKTATEEARALEEWAKLADEERMRVPRPTQTPMPREFSEQLLEPHVLKPRPEWLKKRLRAEP